MYAGKALEVQNTRIH